jgi:hypothetical protein
MSSSGKSGLWIVQQKLSLRPENFLEIQRNSLRAALPYGMAADLTARVVWKRIQDIPANQHFEFRQMTLHPAQF